MHPIEFSTVAGMEMNFKPSYVLVHAVIGVPDQLPLVQRELVHQGRGT